MKLWQQTAQQLPVRVRPLRMETLFSYAARLAAANELNRPTTLLRALGHPHGNLTQTALRDHDIALNPPALARLETFTGIPAQRLRKALPAVNGRVDLPGDIPRTKLLRCWNLRQPCDGCASRIPGRPTIMVHSPGFPALCTRHRRWLDGDKVRSQIELGDVPEMMTAHRRYLRLRTRIAVDRDSREWLQQQLRTACAVAQGWVTRSRWDNPRMHHRWAARNTVLKPWSSVVAPSDLLVFPEAVALTEILTDLRWRRHVAMAQHDTDLKPFYRRVAERLNQPPRFAATTHYLLRRDPLRRWIDGLRQHHEPTRTEYWQRQRTGQRTQPLPEIRHFK